MLAGSDLRGLASFHARVESDAESDSRIVWLTSADQHGEERDMPQVSKGDRAVITARIPVSYDRKLRDWVDTTGETRTNLIERLLRDFLDNHDPADQAGQEELPLQKTA